MLYIPRTKEQLTLYRTFELITDSSKLSSHIPLHRSRYPDGRFSQVIRSWSSNKHTKARRRRGRSRPWKKHAASAAAQRKSNTFFKLYSRSWSWSKGFSHRELGLWVRRFSFFSNALSCVSQNLLESSLLTGLGSMKTICSSKTGEADRKKTYCSTSSRNGCWHSLLGC